MSEQPEDYPRTPYEILGDDGIRALARTFYEVMDERQDAAPIRAMHADNLSPVASKLAAYLTGWMGGPPVYLAMAGTVCLTDPHAPYAIGEAERDQWLACMYEALERVDASDELKNMLREPLFQVADTIVNQRGDQPCTPEDPNIIARG